MRRQIAKGGEIESHEAFEQVEGRGKGRCARRIQPPGQGQNREGNAETENQRQSPDEIGNCQEDTVAKLENGFERRAAQKRGRDRHGAAGKDAEDERGEGQLQRGRQAFANQPDHIAPQGNRRAEIARCHGFEPDDELLEQPEIQAVTRAQGGDIGGRCTGRNHHRHGIAGNDAQKTEDDDRHTDQRDEGGQHSAEKMKNHRVTPGTAAFHALS